MADVHSGQIADVDFDRRRAMFQKRRSKIRFMPGASIVLAASFVVEPGRHESKEK
jgi:hypothetical protein